MKRQMSDRTDGRPFERMDFKSWTKAELIDSLLIHMRDRSDLSSQLASIRSTVASIETQLATAASQRDQLASNLSQAKAEKSTAESALRTMTQERDAAVSDRDRLLGYLDRVIEDDAVRERSAGEIMRQHNAPSVEQLRQGPKMSNGRTALYR